jgi:histidinol dehydrogenase
MTVVALASRKADPDVVQILREALAQAEAGEIAEIVVVANCPDANAFWYRASFEDRWRVLGALAWASSQVCVE